MGNGTVVEILKAATMITTDVEDGMETTISNIDIKYVPEITTKLILDSCIRQHGIEVKFKTGKNATVMVITTEKDSGTIVMKDSVDRLGIYEMLLAPNIAIY